MDLIVHYPKTQEKQQELSCLVARVHADSVVSQIKQLKCTDDEKMKLLKGVIQAARDKLDT